MLYHVFRPIVTIHVYDDAKKDGADFHSTEPYTRGIAVAVVAHSN
jgi:hypothetical protein